MEEEKSRLALIEEKMDEILEQGVKKKSFKMPRKGKLSKGKLKAGFTTVIVINENRSLDFIKEQIEGGTIRLDDTWHAVNEDDLFFFKGKPVVIIPKVRKNPYNPMKLGNETYGQKHIMARMKNDIIKVKKKMGGLIIWLLLGAGAVYLISQVFLK